MIRVVKRDGRVEILDISKIQKYTSGSVEGLTGVSQSELEVDANLHFRDMISSKDIQETLIKTAVDKIDIDRPNWTFVASRLFLYDLYHRVSQFTGYKHLRDYFERGEIEGRILLGLKEKYDLDDLNYYLRPERDLQFTYLGIKTLYDRYLLKDSEGKPIELPQHLFMGVAMFLAQNEPDCQAWAKKFYDILSKFEVMAATPTLSNARTPRHQLSSCYIGSTSDNIEGIFDVYKEMALLSKFGGGIGWDWSQVRGMGSFIDDHKHAAGGIVPFLKITNDVAIAVDQLGTRRGAIAVYIEPWHLDIRDFLDLKKNSGEERRRAHDLFPALWLNDLFMQRVQEDSTWTLFDPYEVRELTDIYGKEFETRYIELENSSDTITREVISAKGLWKEILRSYFETGNPFLTFKDTANRTNPNKHSGMIRSSNLCVTGDTKILTKKYGYVPIQKVSGKSLECWNGEEWSKTEIFQTSTSQKVIKVELSSQQTIEATPYHKWVVIVEDERGKKVSEVIKRTHELEKGDKLAKFDLEPIPHGIKILKYAYENGFYTADGTKVKNNTIIGAKIYLYDEKRALLNFFGGYKDKHTQDRRVSLNYEHKVLKKKFFIPNNKYSVQSRLDWLAGYIDGDGVLADNESSQSIQIASTNREFLLDLKLMLQELGIHSNISHFKDEGYRVMPRNDGSGKSKEYWCKAQSQLNISGKAINRLLELGYRGHRVTPNKKDYNRSAIRYVKVVNVIDEEVSKPTYCGNEPKRNRMMFDGVITMQCTEIFQNTAPNNYKIRLTFNDGSVAIYEEEEMIKVDNGMTKPAKKITALDSLNGKQIWMVDKEQSDGDTAVCNLASINLSKINSTEDIARVVPIAIRMLDNVIDLNFYPLAKAKKTNEKTRAIGLGVMGEAQMLAESKIIWGSNEHFYKIDEVMESVSYYAIKSSSDLAIEKGKYPTYEGSEWSKGLFPIDKANSEACKLVDRGGLFGYTHDWVELKETVKINGMRNGYLMAVAPTSSISILTGTTQAIEPVYKRKWFEENLSGLIPVVVPKLSPDTWEYYIPSYDLNQNVLVKAGAIRQKWIDQGQSLNIFLSLDKASGKYLNEIYMNAWKYGLKSTYYLRSQSPEASNDIEDRSQECVGCQ